MKKQAIVVHQDELRPLGVDVIPLQGMPKGPQEVHRDDHYMFIIQRQGQSAWEVDFDAVTLSGASFGYVAPGQVHRYLRVVKADGWLAFVKPELIPAPYREILNTYQRVRQTASIAKDDAAFTTLPLLLKTLDEDDTPLRRTFAHSIIDVLAGMIASAIAHAHSAVNLIGGQKYNTVLRFKNLVALHYKATKQVKDYSSLLHITPLYLNEVVKEITGFPASFWIHEEILLEAKRLLHYTSMDVKQIAHTLGYDDHAYFSRFFRKHTGMTASEFRNR
jgi:AraC family transcriptional regulator, transcriptional activator of pobA